MTNIHVLIPSYNCGPWIERCLRSVAEQEHKPAQVLVIDDASTDEDYSSKARFWCGGFRYRYWRNDENMKCPYNLRLGIDLLAGEFSSFPMEGIGDEDVIFLLDGDDFLPHSKVFTRFAEVYSDPEVWLTYGNYQPHPHNTGQALARAYPPQVIRDRSFRTAGACFNHPLTFRKFLWDEVTDADMQTRNGKWFTGGYDMVIMAPMLEMCGERHYRFLDEHLYTYNAVNPISDSSVNVPLVEESREMMRRPKKGLLIREP